jgi:hypothetical protein
MAQDNGDDPAKELAIANFERRLRRKIRAHVRKLGFVVDRDWSIQAQEVTKERVRLLHAQQRRDRLESAKALLDRCLHDNLMYFASGSEVRPERIKPRLELVESGTTAADLFRIASLTWSVPVSQGYGRRMRFLVWDSAAEKLIGIFALGDPVFNLRVRDDFVGWTAEERAERLVDVMDAYVLGSVPPYSLLLGGKLIASLLRTTDIRDAFWSRYKNSCGVISGIRKSPSLVMISTTSALGRSSVYNRVRLNGIEYLRSVGFTSGYGHFHVDGDLFGDIREYLRLVNHPYAADYRFGKGPNWKFRAIRAAFELIGVNRGVLQHGLGREVFVCTLARNAERVLRNQDTNPDYGDLLSASKVSELALDRWICPRAARMPQFADWRREEIVELLRVPCGWRPVRV